MGRHRTVTEPFGQPAPGTGGVGEGLHGGEGLGGDDEQGCLRVGSDQRPLEVGTVDVGHETHIEAGIGKGGEGARCHGGAEVGAADPNVDHGAEPPTRHPGPFTGTHTAGEGGHGVEDLVHAGDDVGAVHLDHGAPGSAQGGVEHGAVFGGVDPPAGEHGVASLRNPGGGGEFEEQPHRAGGHALLGVVEVQPPGLGDEGRPPCRVVGEEPAQMERTDPVRLVPERPPLRGVGDRAEPGGRLTRRRHHRLLRHRRHPPRSRRPHRRPSSAPRRRRTVSSRSR